MSQQLKADTLGKRWGQTGPLQDFHNFLFKDFLKQSWFLFSQWTLIDFPSVKLWSLSWTHIDFFSLQYSMERTPTLSYMLRTTLPWTCYQSVHPDHCHSWFPSPLRCTLGKESVFTIECKVCKRICLANSILVYLQLLESNFQSHFMS